MLDSLCEDLSMTIPSSIRQSSALLSFRCLACAYDIPFSFPSWWAIHLQKQAAISSPGLPCISYLSSMHSRRGLHHHHFEREGSSAKTTCGKVLWRLISISSCVGIRQLEELFVVELLEPHPPLTEHFHIYVRSRSLASAVSTRLYEAHFKSDSVFC